MKETDAEIIHWELAPEESHAGQVKLPGNLTMNTP
jgi:hypothetical protein